MSSAVSSSTSHIGQRDPHTHKQCGSPDLTQSQHTLWVLWRTPLLKHSCWHYTVNGHARRIKTQPCPCVRERHTAIVGSKVSWQLAMGTVYCRVGAEMQHVNTNILKQMLNSEGEEFRLWKNNAPLCLSAPAVHIKSLVIVFQSFDKQLTLFWLHCLFTFPLIHILPYVDVTVFTPLVALKVQYATHFSTGL